MREVRSARKNQPWLPSVAGGVLALPIAVAMIRVWHDYAPFLLVFALICGGMPFFVKGPIARTASTAVFGGILLALLFH